MSPARGNDKLVDRLLREGALGAGGLERAFRAVRRHWFLPEVDLDQVYADRAIVTHRGAGGIPISSSSQPALMARMLEQLQVEVGMAVLEIGTGTGYNAALLGHLVGSEGTVHTVDLDPGVTSAAERHLASAGAANVTVATGDGWAPPWVGATYDRIVATVGVWDISPAWVDHLASDGVLVVPLWLRAGQQGSVAFRKAGVGLAKRTDAVDAVQPKAASRWASAWFPPPGTGPTSRVTEIHFRCGLRRASRRKGVYMALGERRGSVARPAQRPMPQAQVSRQSVMNSETGRFEPGLERRWEQAWNRARAGGR